MNLNNINLYICELDKEKAETAKLYFKLLLPDFNNIKIVNDSIENLCKNNKDIDCLVSPSNAYGEMNGGYDFGLSKIIGDYTIKKIKDITSIVSNGFKTLHIIPKWLLAYFLFTSLDVNSRITKKYCFLRSLLSFFNISLVLFTNSKSITLILVH
mgnify:CR=1 FL=1